MFLSTFGNYLKARWAHPQGYKAVLALGLPMIINMASATIMQFTDRLFLSRYSLDAIAASLPAANISLTCFLTLSGLCSYSSVLIAQYTGAKRPEMAGPALWQGLWCGFGGCLILLLLCLPAEGIFALAGHSPEVQRLETPYFQILNVGACFSLLAGVVSTFLYGRGHSRPVMLAGLAAAAVNIPLDYALIYGPGFFPEWGIHGAGVATACGGLLNLLLLFPLVFNRKNDSEFRVLRGWKPDWALLKKLLRFGLPSSFNFFVELGAISWFILEIGRLGAVELAAANIVFSINSIVFLPMVGLSIALSTLAGHSMGRGKPQEVVELAKTALPLSLCYAVPLVSLLILCSGTVVDIFATRGSQAASFADVRVLAVNLLFFIGIYVFGDAINLGIFGLLKGAGDTFAVLCIVVVGVGGFLCAPLLVFIKILHYPLSIYDMWIIFSIYIYALSVMVIWRFGSGRWKNIRVIGKENF